MIKIKEHIYYTPKEYANLKLVTIQTVYNWIKEGIVETKKVLDKTFIKSN